MFIIAENFIPQKCENEKYYFFIFILYANFIAFLEVAG